jgi:hypothetical protein
LASTQGMRLRVSLPAPYSIRGTGLLAVAAALAMRANSSVGIRSLPPNILMNKEFKISTEWDGQRRKLYRTKCGACPNVFYAPKHAKAKFCSPECSASSNSRVSRMTVECWTCKLPLSRTASKIKAATHGVHFCSRKCKDIAQSIRGDGGCKAIQPLHFGTGKSSYRQANLDDLLTGCVDCGEKRLWMLEFHHIDGNRKNNKKTNLEPVCNNDHQKRHLRLVGGIWIRDNRVLTPRELLPLL